MKHTIKITVILISIFLLAQFLGLLIIQKYIDVQKTAETGTTTFEDLQLGIERPPVQPQYSFIYITSAVLIGTIILLILIKYNLKLIWKLWYFLAVLISLIIAFNAFIPTSIAIASAVIIAAWKLIRPNIIIHNLSELFIYGGLAAIFVPILNIFAAIMLLIVISLYDMYAVWKSKHMIAMAKFQSSNNMFAGFYVPYKKTEKKKLETKSAVLGGGDIAFPLLFTGTMFAQLGIIAFIIPLTTTIALALLLLKGKKDTFYPAMPFLTIGCLIGYGIIMAIQW